MLLRASMRNSRPTLARRCQLTEGMNFDIDDIFTSLSNGQPLGHLLALPPLNVGSIEHLDLKNTILQGDLTKVIYITQPINF